MGEAVDCPKCVGKMVPLSTYIHRQTDLGIPSKYGLVSLPYFQWRCVKCGYTVSAGS